MQMKDLHVGDRVVLFERSQRLGGGMPAKGRYVAHTVKAKKGDRVVLQGGRVVLPSKVIAVELK